MAVLEEIKVINIDGSPIAVEDLSDSAKSLVDIYNVFRFDEQKAKHELIKTQAALRDIQREIVSTIKKEQDELEESKTEESDLDVVDSEPSSGTDTTED